MHNVVWKSTIEAWRLVTGSLDPTLFLFFFVLKLCMGGVVRSYAVFSLFPQMLLQDTECFWCVQTLHIVDEFRLDKNFINPLTWVPSGNSQFLQQHDPENTESSQAIQMNMNYAYICDLYVQHQNYGSFTIFRGSQSYAGDDLGCRWINPGPQKDRQPFTSRVN